MGGWMSGKKQRESPLPRCFESRTTHYTTQPTQGTTSVEPEKNSQAFLGWSESDIFRMNVKGELKRI